ncbi:hypothetical protein SSS_00876 [Sarcoptes scabiei]|uniref:VWFC domain-containing protein n=1 Tax=Sarcoptes scabiei TaxID=52283 RepID=A0A834RCF9_SARSC|nr:hypothetical protein SSS_00876 [Sarcoptes scabiei]
MHRIRYSVCLILASFLASGTTVINGFPFRLKRAFSYHANQTACTVDFVVYKDGDPIPTDDPCETCRCRPPGFTCTLRHCEVKTGCRAIRRIGECCPQYQCGCEHNGQYYKDGDRIYNAESPCYSCYCQGSSITCSLADCQFRFDCEPEYVIGECCPRYDHCEPENRFNHYSTQRIFVQRPKTTTPNQMSTPSLFLSSRRFSSFFDNYDRSATISVTKPLSTTAKPTMPTIKRTVETNLKSTTTPKAIQTTKPTTTTTITTPMTVFTTKLKTTITTPKTVSNTRLTTTTSTPIAVPHRKSTTTMPTSILSTKPKTTTTTPTTVVTTKPLSITERVEIEPRSSTIPDEVFSISNNIKDDEFLSNDESNATTTNPSIVVVFDDDSTIPESLFDTESTTTISTILEEDSQSQERFKKDEHNTESISMISETTTVVDMTLLPIDSDENNNNEMTTSTESISVDSNPIAINRTQISTKVSTNSIDVATERFESDPIINGTIVEVNDDEENELESTTTIKPFLTTIGEIDDD